MQTIYYRITFVLFIYAPVQFHSFISNTLNVRPFCMVNFMQNTLLRIVLKYVSGTLHDALSVIACIHYLLARQIEELFFIFLH